jgi:hypothetical protein
MLEPQGSNLSRARVRLRDLLAAWLLVAIIGAAVALPSVVQTARAEAVTAAGAARCEAIGVLHAIPKLLQGNHQA